MAPLPAAALALLPLLLLVPLEAADADSYAGLSNSAGGVTGRCDGGECGLSTAHSGADGATPAAAQLLLLFSRAASCTATACAIAARAASWRPAASAPACCCATAAAFAACECSQIA